MRFEKVSFEQYKKDSFDDELLSWGYYANPMRLEETDIERIYNNIMLPTRSTAKSAGYDFYAPYTFKLAPGDTIRIATGIRVILEDDKFLMCAPRSGHGFKARIQLDNTIGIIDADYSNADNEGHILMKFTNDSKDKVIQVNAGKGMLQAIIMKYFTVDDDNASAERTGGIGSTDNK